jgi:hypothetical protein
MESLKDICHKKIVETIMSAPPLIKEEVIGKSVEIINKKREEQIIGDYKSKVKFYLIFLVEQMIESETLYYKDFHSLFPHIDKDIFDMAVSMVEIFKEKTDRIKSMNLNTYMNDDNDDVEVRSESSYIDYDSM